VGILIEVNGDVLLEGCLELTPQGPDKLRHPTVAPQHDPAGLKRNGFIYNDDLWTKIQQQE
jgi:hypothetical protein